MVCSARLMDGRVSTKAASGWVKLDMRYVRQTKGRRAGSMEKM